MGNVGLQLIQLVRLGKMRLSKRQSVRPRLETRKRKVVTQQWQRLCSHIHHQGDTSHLEAFIQPEGIEMSIPFGTQCKNTVCEHRLIMG